MFDQYAIYHFTFYKLYVQHVYINTLQVSIANTNVLSIILYLQHIYINTLQVSLGNALLPVQ